MNSDGINKGIVIIIILLIVLILGFNAYVLYERYLYDHSNNIELNDNVINDNASISNNSINIKEFDDLEYVYDADYDLSVNTNSYTIGSNEYNIDDYKVPYINVKSDYVNNANNEIKTLWDNMVKVFNDGVNDKTSYIKYLDYEYTVSNDILSLFIKYSTSTTNGESVDYKTYNISLKDGSECSLVDAVKKLDYDLTAFREKTTDGIIQEYDNWYSNHDVNGSLKQQYYDEYKEQTLNEYKLDKWYIDNDNNINVIVHIYVPTDVNYFNEIVTVKK